MTSDQVGHIMTTAVLSVDVHEPITEAIRLFAYYPVHHLPVVDKSRIVGMLSTADMLKLEYFVPRGSIPAATLLINEKFRIEQLMRTPVITATPYDTIADAAERMSSRGIHALPVVNELNHLIGIVTTTDVMNALLNGSGITLQREEEEKIEIKPPTEHRLAHALEAARSALQRGDDGHAIGACLLYFHERNSLLESLRHNVERYVRNGQDERLHTQLLKDIDKLEQQQHAALALRL
ncbi:MAG: CBS domain-containing protein [Steroidobacter sp.]